MHGGLFVMAAGPVATLYTTYAIDIDVYFKKFSDKYKGSHLMMVQRGAGQLKKQAEMLTRAMFKTIVKTCKIEGTTISTGWPNPPKIWEISMSTSAGQTFMSIQLDGMGTTLMIKLLQGFNYNGADQLDVAEGIETIAKETIELFEIDVKFASAVEKLGRYKKTHR